jgi:putative ABC transport system permease protein
MKNKGITQIWLKGLLTSRAGRLIAAALGVSITVAMLVALGMFVTASAAAMTAQATEAIPVDWQVQLVPGTDPQAIMAAARQAAPVDALQQVGYADVSGLAANTGGTVQTTGAGKAVSLPAGYFSQFPAEARLLLGSLQGVLVAQQTAANLHVTVGDRLTISRVGLPPVDAIVAGVVDLPYADTFFQAVGMPANAAPQAPPDNVVFLPSNEWQTLFAPQAAVRPDTVRSQLHIRLKRNLPGDPNAAFIQVQGWARNLEARIAGSGVVGDNLAARLDGVRSDAAYARVLFLFLGLPGVLLAAVLTLAIAATGADRRRQEQALLRVRGAALPQLVRLAMLEGTIMGITGVLFGMAFGWLAFRWITPGIPFDGNEIWMWIVLAVLAGLCLSLAATLWPAWRQAHVVGVAIARQSIRREQKPLWERIYLDFVFLVVAGIMVWRTAGIGYELVLAPEGVAQVSISYEAFIAPLCLWLGSSLLAMRLSKLFLARGRLLFVSVSTPFTGSLADPVFASLRRQRSRLAQGIALVGLATAFAVSTAIFNTTYDAQARVDAELTNGADVLVQGTTASPAGSLLPSLAALPGVAAAEPMQHRFAYVGTDLQDIYGIDPGRITRATHLANAYFGNRDAQATLAALVARPDGVLVSDETMKDYQLSVGDHLNLRMQFASDHQYHVVPFTFIGVVREFPTAPKDSFLVANASYLAQQTGMSSSEIVLLKTSADPTGVAAKAAQLARAAPGIQVTEIGAAQKAIGSSLTAVNLRGLSTLELGFAIFLVAVAAGLILGLGFAERKKAFVGLLIMGAKPRQLGVFVWGEGLVIYLSGVLVGLLTGVGLADLFVIMLTHIFDPPPETLILPWLYLALLLVASVCATVMAIRGAIRATRRAGVSQLRSL